MLGHDLSWRLNIAIFACVMVFCALVLGAPLSLPPHHASGRKLQPEEAEMSKERRICSKSNLELYIYITIFIRMTAFTCTGLGQAETLEAQASN